MHKHFIFSEKRFNKAWLLLIVISLLTAAAIMAPGAKAQSLSVTLTPSSGSPGTPVIVMITGFQTDMPVSINFGTTNIGSITIPYGWTQQSMEFTVPQVPLGTYTITATAVQGQVSTAKFDVTERSATPTPTSTPTLGSTGTSTGLSTVPPAPTALTTTTTTSSGFWSPIAIAIASIVVAIAVFMTAKYVQSSRQKPLTYEEASRLQPRPSTPQTGSTPSTNQTSSKKSTSPYRPYQSSKLNQPYQPYQSTQTIQPYQTSKINQQSTNNQRQPYTTICKHCKRTVRDDLNICPYCSKRIR